VFRCKPISLNAGDGTDRDLGTQAWTSYVGIVLGGLLLLLIGTLEAWIHSPLAGVIVALLIICGIAYKIMSLRAYHLYYDEMGVWLYSGILPWNKGVRGVKWRDLDDATYIRSLGSWLLKSYNIRIGHRFTRSNELVLKGIAHGDKAVVQINQRLQNLARAGPLN
jgi:hypothetical protein